MNGKIMVPPKPAPIHHHCSPPDTSNGLGATVEGNYGALWQCCICKKYWYCEELSEGIFNWMNISPRSARRLIKLRNKQ